MKDNYFFEKDIEFKELEKDKNYRRILAYSDNVMIVEVKFLKDAVGYSHKHPHEQISYVIDGEFEYTVDKKSMIIKKGDSVFIPSDVIHSCKVLTNEGTLLDVFTPARKDFLMEN